MTGIESVTDRGSHDCTQDTKNRPAWLEWRARIWERRPLQLTKRIWVFSRRTVRNTESGNNRIGFNFQRASLEGRVENRSEGAEGPESPGERCPIVPCSTVGTVAVGIERSNCGHGGVGEP